MNSKTPINLAEFPIINDTSLYTVWADEPVSIYDNIHPEWFIIK
jgi:hypothetical protein